MNRQKRFVCLGLAIIVALLSSGFGKMLAVDAARAGSQAEEAIYTDFREIPGVTDEEIQKIESILAEVDSFSYAMTSSIEAFADEDGQLRGYATFVTEWLSQLFGIPFELRILPFHEILSGLASLEIDFSGTMTATEERLLIYSMSNPITERFLQQYRLKDSLPLEIIAQSRLPIFAFLEGSFVHGRVQELLEPGTFESVYITDSTQAYDLLASGGADVYIHENHAEAVFAGRTDIDVEMFYPVIYEGVSVATQNPDYGVIIDVMDKALTNATMRHLSDLYGRGYQDYLRFAFRQILTEEEREFLETAGTIPVLAEKDHYPISFYDTRAGSWDGIYFDVLRRITELADLEFEVVNDTDTERANLIAMLERGEGWIYPEMIYMAARQGEFLWAQNPTFMDQYALISRLELENINFNEILHLKVGVAGNSPFSDLFNAWFPRHQYVTKYYTTEDAFDALGRGEVDVVMSSVSRLLVLTNYLGNVGYKANFVFAHSFGSTMGFYKDAPILASIIDKALPIVDSESISDQWLRRNYDYRLQVVNARLPFLIGAIGLFFIAVILLFILFRSSRNKGKELIGLVEERTLELSARNVIISNILDSIPDMLFVKDIHSRYIACSKSFRDLVVTYDGDVEGKTGRQITSVPEDLAKYNDERDQRIMYGGKTETTDEWFHLKDGSQIYCEVVATPLRQDGEVNGILVISKDITKRMEMEQELMAANKAKSDFLANMSHEMRTPMSVIIGLTELRLEDDSLAEDIKEDLNKINTAGSTLLSIINDILDISKIESGKLELDPVEYNVPSLLNDIITINMVRIGEKPISFKLDISEDLPSELLGDDLRVKQIFNNLLSNAFKYTQEGTVTLGLRHVREGEDILLTISVSDTGVGIREADIEKLFSDYNQVDTRANRKIEGTGLGLAITKRLVELMGGTISVESEYGKGSTFYVRIKQGFVTEAPIGKDIVSAFSGFRYKEKRRRGPGSIKRPDLSHARVLVVDDFQTNLDVSSSMLRKYKLSVDTVLSGREAVDLIKGGEPAYDAIFMDHMMPEMDGIEATKRIREITTDYAKNLPIIALTANALAGNEQMFLENGFDAFLSKPINITKLDEVIKKYISEK